MTNKLKEKILTKNFLRFSLICIGFLIILFSHGIRNFINQPVTLTSHQLLGESKVSDKIHLIKITEHDVKQLGWPIKRNYYALVINELHKLGVKNIGIEIFFSKNFTSQSIYNELLSKKILEAGNVCLSSFAENVRVEDEKFIADEINYSQPVIENRVIKSGHLNYFTEDGEIIIPQVIENEKAFSIITSSVDYKEELIVLNKNVSWKSFSSETMLDFLAKAANGKADKKDYRNKIVLLGVTDITLSKYIPGYFDKIVPGLGLHAIAMNNLLLEESLSTSYYQLSTILIFVLFLLIAFLERKFIVVFFVFITVMIVAILIQKYLFVKLDFSISLISFAAFLVADSIFNLVVKEKTLSEVINENTALQKSLSIKEEKLDELKQVESKSQHKATDLENKIYLLQKEIDNLKDLEKGSKAFEFSSDQSSPKNFFGMIYTSNKMESITHIIEKVAPEEATVLVLGESGSGKELVANAIHKLSKRANGNFVAINCAALPENLLESELFGYKKGAFTNAHADKIGLFEAANEGTIFLDEIGETPENFQVKLLRVLQTGEFTKIGNTSVQKTNARVIAATNKSLSDLVKEKKFRQDLYYRLNVITIELPNLAERTEDIPAIANYFVMHESAELKISKLVMENLIKNSWEGNVRELESVIKRAVIFCKSDGRDVIQLTDLPDELSKRKHSNIEELIIQTLRDKNFSHNSIIETGKELGNVSRTIISENLRGMIFKAYVETNFNIDLTVQEIADSSDQETLSRVKIKAERYLKNVRDDIQKIEVKTFELVKEKLNSKFKNLPQRYHSFLDEIIKHYLHK